MATIPLPARFQARLASGKIDAEQLALYDRHGIEVPWFRFGKPEQRWLRVSAQIYNSPADYEFLARAVETL
jgi:isopenicillin-N epimerase